MKEENRRKNLFSNISSGDGAKKDSHDYPFTVQRRLKSFNTAIIVFLLFGAASWAFTKSFYSVLLGIMLAAMTFVLKCLQKTEMDVHGYDVWRFKVIEYTYLTFLNKRPTGMYIEAFSGPYAGKTCHVALQSQGVVPPIGRMIDLYLLGDTEASPVRNVFYIPQYFGIELVPEDE